MTPEELFKRQQREQEHREMMAMLVAEREAADHLRDSYLALEQQAKATYKALLAVRTAA